MGFGINLKKFLVEHREIDIIQFINDENYITPYLENGELMDFSLIDGLESLFMGNFFYFAAWFN
ncbi:MAG: hypothetical protein JW969_19745 [Spirochaetales bacterium]|nr:hypothetical protein [Spirochaetales bacterium]